jgi:hypothetical protein
MKKRMPYGIANFEEIATKPFYYIDKTHYIEKLELINFPVFLRPRRFGKSLFTEMLRWYYDIKAKDKFNQIFGNLNIGKNPTGNQNKYFFLSLDFSGMDTSTEGDENSLKRKFDSSIIVSLEGFLLYYKEYLQIDHSFINHFVETYRENATDGLKKIIEILRSTGEKLYITIDEYDSLTNALAIRYRYSSADDNMYLKILQKGGFFRSFFEALKLSVKTTIEQIYITGILPITISDLKSGFNIATWITFDLDFINMLGITNSEFDGLIDQVYLDYEITLPKQMVKETIKTYYNGYRFLPQSENVYNPMMTLYFLDYVMKRNQIPTNLLDRNLQISYNQIAFLFGQNKEEASKIMTQIADTKEFQIMSDLNISFDMIDFKEGRYIAEGLFYSGILTFSDYHSTLKIPNIVTYDFALDYFEKVNSYDSPRYEVNRWMVEYMDKGNVTALIEGFFRDIVQAFPGDFFANVNESFYHGLFFHILFNYTNKNFYEVLPEYNLTNGQVDIMLCTFPGAHVRYNLNDLFELKRVSKKATDQELQAEFDKGMVQMKTYLTGNFSAFRGVVVCFRGNKDFMMNLI